jgi:hypothetical protein
MSDENKTVEQNECKCFCRSEGFRKFLIVALGSFVGVYCALSLFFAIHKPPMPMPIPVPVQTQMGGCPYVQMHHFRKFEKPEGFNFEKQMQNKMEKRTPFNR